MISIKPENSELYLQMLLAERGKLEPFKSVVPLTAELLDAEIERLQISTGTVTGIPSSFAYSDTGSEIVKRSEKIPIPVDNHPGFNFVGRVLGPGGATVKKIESEFKCKILIRGEGSLRSKSDEEKKKGQPGFEHLNEPLHILVEVTLPEKIAELYLAKARESISSLLVPPNAEDGLDAVKISQLRELAAMKSSARNRPAAPTPLPPPVQATPYPGYPPNYSYDPYSMPPQMHPSTMPPMMPPQMSQMSQIPQQHTPYYSQLQPHPPPPQPWAATKRPRQNY